MSANRDRGRACPAPRADLLPWYAAGSLDAVDREKVARHLDACSACRGEVAALVSMGETVRRHDRADHVDVADLVEWETRGPGSDPALAGRIIDHVRSCSACQEDLQALRDARREVEARAAEDDVSPPIVPGTVSRWPGVRMLTAAAALAVIVAGTALPVIRALRVRLAAPGSAARAIDVTTVTVSPSRRGVEDRAHLPGDGPWVLDVILPFGAPAGVYETQILEVGGASVPGPALGRRASANGHLRLMISTLPRHGYYLLRLGPPGPSQEPYMYPLEWSVDAGTSSNGAPR
jgi:anti-sigma factor RsiW